MTDTDSHVHRTPPEAAEFTERLRIPWWYWPLPLAGALLLAAEVHMGYPGLRSWVPYVVLLPLAVWLLAWLGRTRVGVVGGELVAGDARLPLKHVGRVEVLEGDAKRVALGREFDPAAFVAHRFWVRGALRVEVRDPDTDTPYWIVSVRSAERLASLLRRERTSG